ncbi:MAG: acylphosphatase [bacterium]|nr:acylphosphatase [bacterium]
MHTEAKRIECRVFGKVQGVFYRTYACQKGRARGLVGKTENLPDGSVLVAAEGSEEELRMFIGELSAGPASAEVLSIDVSWRETTDEFSDFSVQ